ncbi:MAG: phosphoribosylamine--glycine ligase [Acidobacteriota bacterium]
MKVLVLGSGGREHALAWRLSRDADVTEVVVAPGNPGMARVARLVPADLAAPDELLALAGHEHVDLTVVGPEAPLERGVADLFRAQGRAIVGPSQAASALECSKAYAKAFMVRHDIPTARFVTCDGVDAALAAVGGSEFGFPVVVKADGLAGGKGVTVAENRAEAEAAVRAAMLDRQFGAAGATVVIEECLTGPEVSCFVLTDGNEIMPLSTAQDHKRIRDGDRGPNTGGMGAFAPSPLLSPSIMSDVIRRIARPVVIGMREEGHPYQGFLYISLMLTPQGPKVIEFNVRLGDPEAQVVLPLVQGRLAVTLFDAAAGHLRLGTLAEGGDRLVGVVLAARGYPGPPETGHEIRGLDRAGAVPGALVFHAGTRLVDGRLVTAGGRVLTVVGQARSFDAAIAAAYTAASLIEFDGMQYRRDIGQKAIGATVIATPATVATPS